MALLSGHESWLLGFDATSDVGYSIVAIKQEEVMTDAEIKQEIERLEKARCRALVESDIEALERLVADDLVHVHANGKIDDKHAYLSLVKNAISFLSAQRQGPLDVRVYGDLAIATGPLAQSIAINGTTGEQAMSILTTQIWRLQDDRWRQISFQATNIVTA